MLRKTITINNKLGLHARASMKWVKIARCFISEITIKCDGKRVDGKSILEVMGLTARQGSPVEVTVKGEDEAAALTVLEKLVTDRFGEE
ncbi:MAG: HPr family phosphocarrier protein [Pseudomonadota bacterium]